MGDEVRYEDVPINELDEWITRRIRDEIANAFEGVAKTSDERYVEFALRWWANNLRPKG